MDLDRAHFGGAASLLSPGSGLAEQVFISANVLLTGGQASLPERDSVSIFLLVQYADCPKRVCEKGSDSSTAQIENILNLKKKNKTKTLHRLPILHWLLIIMRDGAFCWQTI